MGSRHVALEAILLTLISFLVVSITPTEAVTLCLLYLSILVLIRSFFLPRVQMMESIITEVRESGTMSVGVYPAHRLQTSAVVPAKYYAVACGLRPGVYDSWNECALQVIGVKGVVYKFFPTKE